MSQDGDGFHWNLDGRMVSKMTASRWSLVGGGQRRYSFRDEISGAFGVELITAFLKFEYMNVKLVGWRFQKLNSDSNTMAMM